MNVSKSDDSEPDGRAFERLAGALEYPVFVVTTLGSGTRSGCLVGFTTQTSIDPLRFLVCLSRENQTYRVAVSAQRLAVHALAREQIELARLFGEHSGDEFDKFRHCAWHPDAHGVPILDRVSAWFSGPILQRVPMGDHIGFLTEPDDGHIVDAMRSKLLTSADVAELNAGHDA